MFALVPLDASPSKIVFGESQDLARADRSLVAEAFKEERLLLLRDYQVDSNSFMSFTGSMGQDFLPYEGGASERETIEGNPTLFSVNLPRYKGAMPLHGEMYYRSVAPRIVWFWCERPAESGGATTLADGVRFLETMRPETRRFFENQKIRYLRFYADQVWQGIFRTDDLDRVRDICRQGSVSMMVRYEGETPTVCTAYECSAIISTAATSEPAFINNIMAVLYRERVGGKDSIVRMEDGSRIPDSIVQDLERTANACTFPVNWHAGDVLMIDNTRFLHGRAPFSGDRKVCSRLCRTPAPGLGFRIA